jgi:hypothetical protein
VLRKTGRGRGEEGARVLVLVELERERRADDLVLIVARHARSLHPAAPVVERPLEEPLRRLLEAGLERLAPGEDEVAVTLQQERPLVLDVRQRDVRREADRCREARELDVVGRAPASDVVGAVVVGGPATDPRAWLARQRSEDPDQHRRLEEAVEELEAGREVDELERPALAVEGRPEDVRVLCVHLLDRVGVDTLDRELAALLPIEERPEDEARVGTRPAQPLDRALLDERVVRAVPDDREALAHGRIPAGP